MVGRALSAGVVRMVAVGGTKEMNRCAVEAAGRFPDVVCAAWGYDRDQAVGAASGAGGVRGAVETLKTDIARRIAGGAGICAVGEMGLDFHYSAGISGEQIELLRGQLGVARELSLPVIVHSREADSETIAELEAHSRAWEGPRDGQGVLHCFTGDSVFAGQLLDIGFCISFSGIVTFRNADALRRVARDVPSDRLLIETDSPYLAPVPHRGKRNEPAYVLRVAEVLAEARKCSIEDVAEVTMRNAERLFGA